MRDRTCPFCNRDAARLMGKIGCDPCGIVMDDDKKWNKREGEKDLVTAFWQVDARLCNRPRSEDEEWVVQTLRRPLLERDRGGL